MNIRSKKNYFLIYAINLNNGVIEKYIFFRDLIFNFKAKIKTYSESIMYKICFNEFYNQANKILKKIFITTKF